jgi:hypothetical protein
VASTLPQLADNVGAEHDLDWRAEREYRPDRGRQVQGNCDTGGEGRDGNQCDEEGLDRVAKFGECFLADMQWLSLCSETKVWALSPKR